MKSKVPFLSYVWHFIYNLFVLGNLSTLVNKQKALPNRTSYILSEQAKYDRR